MGTGNWLDWVLSVIVVASVVAAILKGFVRELIALAALVAALVVAALGYPRASLWFDDLTRSHEVALGLGFLTLFVGTLIVGALASALAKRLIKTAGLQWFDRFLGGIFGLVRGLVVDSILLMALLAFNIKPEVVQRSLLAPYVSAGARVIVLLMPANLKAEFQAGYERFRQALIQTDKKATGN
jgi:membrane protein required for colicin V production